MTLQQDLEDIAPVPYHVYKKGMVPDITASRPYVEALPRFNVLTLDKQWRSGATKIFWYAQNGAAVGVANITERSLERLVIHYAFNNVDHVLRCLNCVSFKLHWQSRGGADWRPGVVCPECGKDKNVLLIHHYTWACASCHDVANVSSLMDSHTREYQRYAEVRRIVERGRPRYTRHEQYAKLLEEFHGLDAKWSRLPSRYIPADLAARVDEVYFRSEDAPEAWTPRSLQGELISRT